MFKSITFTNRFITACAVVVFSVCFSSCSTKSQLIGRWSYNATGMPGVRSEGWDFLSDNTCNWQRGVSGAKCTYTVMDDGTVKITFSGGQKAEGKLDGGKLIMKFLGEPVVLSKE